MMKAVPLALFLLASGLSEVRALELPWEKEKRPAVSPPAITAVEFIYRKTMDELHGRVGGKLKAGSPKISPKEIRIHLAVAGEGETDLVFVEKENDGKSAMVVVGPPDSEGDVYFLVRSGDAWAEKDEAAPPEPSAHPGMDTGLCNAANAFFSSLREGRMDEAYAMTSPGYREMADRKAFEAFLGKWPALRKHGAAAVYRAVNHRGTGIVDAELQVGESVVPKIELQFDQVDGRWRVGVIGIVGPEEGIFVSGGQSPAPLMGEESSVPSQTAETAVKALMALPEAVEIAGKLKAEPKRFGPLAARIEEEPSDEQRKNHGFRFFGVVVGYDDNELARFMQWQRFGVDAANGQVRVYDVAEDKYVTLAAWRAGLKAP